MDLNFFKPKPPNFLGLQIWSQFSRCNFLSPYSCPHQKDLMIESILLQIVLGTLKQAKVYRGRDWRTEVIRVVLPA